MSIGNYGLRRAFRGKNIPSETAWGRITPAFMFVYASKYIYLYCVRIPVRLSLWQESKTGTVGGAATVHFGAVKQALPPLATPRSDGRRANADANTRASRSNSKTSRNNSFTQHSEAAPRWAGCVCVRGCVWVGG